MYANFVFSYISLTFAGRLCCKFELSWEKLLKILVQIAKLHPNILKSQKLIRQYLFLIFWILKGLCTFNTNIWFLQNFSEFAKVYAVNYLFYGSLLILLKSHINLLLKSGCFAKENLNLQFNVDNSEKLRHKVSNSFLWLISKHWNLFDFCCFSYNTKCYLE